MFVNVCFAVKPDDSIIFWGSWKVRVDGIKERAKYKAVLKNFYKAAKVLRLGAKVSLERDNNSHKHLIRANF